MPNPVLTVQKRDLAPLSGAQIRRAPLSGVPAVFYGQGIETTELSVDLLAFTKLFKTAGENTLIDLRCEEKPLGTALIHEVDFHPVTDEPRHIDFINVRMDREIETKIPVSVAGVSPAVKDMSGILSIIRPEVVIRCLPKDLIHGVTVDISVIKDFHTTIHIKDLNVPPGIKLMHDPSDSVVTVLSPRKEEEAAPVAAVTATAIPEEEAAKQAAEAAKAAEAEKAAKPGAKKEEKK